ncbi:MAG: TolC family protein [Deltaproteobacteria bacterium]|nr:TolC family protein [Deltaproteobacteria bacterium]
MKYSVWVGGGCAICLLFTLCFSNGTLAKEKKVYTLEQCVKEALENNWKLRAKKEQIDQAEYVKKQAQADFLPKLSTTYGYKRYGFDQEVFFNGIPGTPLKVGTQNNYEWRGTVTQPIFTGFAILSAYRLSELGIDQKELEVQTQKLDLALEAKTAYFSILTADMAVETALKAAEALESHAEEARNFYKVGMIPINDLLESQVNASNAKHDLTSARNEARLARSNFNSILSRPVNAEVEVEEISVHTPEKGNFQEYVEIAFKNRPEMKLIDVNLLQTDQQIRLSKSKFYPEVVFTWDYIKQGDTPSVSGGEFHQASNWEATVGLEWTIWEWGKTYYDVKQQQSVKNEVLKSKMELEEQIQLQIKDAVLDLKTAEENIPITQKAVEQGEENLRVSRERFKAQVSTSTEVLDAQRYLTRARVNHFSALFSYHLAHARLLRATGTY